MANSNLIAKVVSENGCTSMFSRTIHKQGTSLCKTMNCDYRVMIQQPDKSYKTLTDVELLSVKNEKLLIIGSAMNTQTKQEMKDLSFPVEVAVLPENKDILVVINNKGYSNITSDESKIKAFIASQKETVEA